MRRYRTEDIRNVALIAHSGAGKTSLGDAMLFDAKAIERLGRVDEGTSTLDYDPDEIKRKITISTAVAQCEWQNAKINLVDTPGYADFIGEVKSGLRVVESAVVAVCATAGVEVGTENVWQFADERSLPRMIAVTKVDRENADFYKTVDTLRNAFGTKCTVIQIPIGSQDSFRGIVDLISMKAIVYSGPGGKFEEQDIPENLKEAAEKYHNELVEVAVENDDELIEKYLEGEQLTEEEIRRGLRQGVVAGKTYPIVCVSALKNIGIQPMLHSIVSYLPSPADHSKIEGKVPGADETRELLTKDDAPLSALVFKTTADPFVGKISLFRVFSGTIRSDAQVYNSNEDATERIGQLFFMRGKQQEPVGQICAGDIGAVAKLGVTASGHTLCDKANPVVLPGIDFPKPTLAMAMKPKAKGDEDKIARVSPALPKKTRQSQCVATQRLLRLL